MKSPDHYDDYLRDACGLDLLDGPPVSLTLEQARAALTALAADADRYRQHLVGALLRSKPATSTSPTNA